jgi:hypothetical protein
LDRCTGTWLYHKGGCGGVHRRYGFGRSVERNAEHRRTARGRGRKDCIPSCFCQPVTRQIAEYSPLYLRNAGFARMF